MTRLLFVATMVAFLAIGAGAAARQQGPAPEGWGPHGARGPFAALNLTDQQREQIKTLMQERRQDEAVQQVRDLRKRLHEAIFADTPDTATIDQLKTQLAAAETAALNARVEHELKLAQILTSEQRQQLRQRPGPGGPRGRRGPRGGPGAGPGA